MLTPSQSLFATRAPSNAGAKMYLKHPVTGKRTDQWFNVLGAESDIFRELQGGIRRQALKLPKDAPEEQRIELSKSTRLDLLSGVVTDWSFDTPCTPAAVREFLVEAPYLAEHVDLFLSENANFLTESSPALPASPSESSV